LSNRQFPLFDFTTATLAPVTNGEKGVGRRSAKLGLVNRDLKDQANGFIDSPRLDSPTNPDGKKHPDHILSGPRTSLWTVACSTASSLKDMGKLQPVYQASNWSW